MPGAAAPIGLPQADRAFFADEGRQVELGRGAQRIDVEGEQFVDAFASFDAFYDQGFGHAAVLAAVLITVLAAGQREQARMLAQAAAGQRADIERVIHEVDAMARAPSDRKSRS
jgi:hypothetical protein